MQKQMEHEHGNPWVSFKGYIGLRVWGFEGLGPSWRLHRNSTPPIVEKQLGKHMENEMESGITLGFTQELWHRSPLRPCWIVGIDANYKARCAEQVPSWSL